MNNSSFSFTIKPVRLKNLVSNEVLQIANEFVIRHGLVELIVLKAGNMVNRYMQLLGLVILKDLLIL
jgi:hypothetical protein